jgi:hypothetical protein
MSTVDRSPSTIWTRSPGRCGGGRITPACRETLRHWPERFAGCDDTTFAGGGLHGVAVRGRGAAAGGLPRCWPSRPSARNRRGPKRRARTDKADARHLRTLVAEGRVPLSEDSPGAGQRAAGAAAGQPGCKALARELYGAGLLVAAIIWAFLGDARRFSSSAQAVRQPAGWPSARQDRGSYRPG